MEGYPLLPARRENLAESERQKNGTHRKTKKKRTMIKKSGRKFLFPIGNARAGGRKKLPPRDVFFFSFPLLFCFLFCCLITLLRFALIWGPRLRRPAPIADAILHVSHFLRFKNGFFILFIPFLRLHTSYPALDANSRV